MNSEEEIHDRLNEVIDDLSFDNESENLQPAYIPKAVRALRGYCAYLISSTRKRALRPLPEKHKPILESAIADNGALSLYEKIKPECRSDIQELRQTIALILEGNNSKES